MSIDYLANHVEWTHLLAFMHQLEMREPHERDLESSVQRFTERLNRDGLPMALVAIEDTIPVGSVSLLEHQLASHPKLSPWVASLFVMEQYRNRGIGDELMRQIESIAVSQGYKRLFLFTNTAEEYYKKSGWTTIDTVHPPEVRHSSVVMAKDLRF